MTTKEKLLLQVKVGTAFGLLYMFIVLVFCKGVDRWTYRWLGYGMYPIAYIVYQKLARNKLRKQHERNVANKRNVEIINTYRGIL